MPFLLRLIEPGRYKLVSEAYAYGLIYGALLGLNKSTCLISII
jgi:hypothetical protein